MNRRIPPFKSPSVLGVALLAVIFVASCSGGGGGGDGSGDGTLPSGLNATFTAKNVSPGANTLRMAPGASSEDTFAVRIEVSDVVDFFGAEFQVAYDPATATFVGFSSNGSFIEAPGVNTVFNAAESAPGSVAVIATRQGIGRGVTASGSQLLITLNFRATATTAGTDFNFGPPQLAESSAGSVPTFTPANPNPGSNNVRMDSGGVSGPNGENFDVRIEVTGVTDFFGAGFRVRFDPSTVSFQGYDSTGSFIEGQGTSTDFEAREVSPGSGELLVNATLQDQVQGVTAVGTQLLMTLRFQGLASSTGNLFTFDVPRTVDICPAPPGACAELSVSWSGGTWTVADSRSTFPATWSGGTLTVN